MYLDPAFAGMLLQILLALVVVGGAIAFSMRRKIRSLFQKNKADIYKNQAAVSSNTSNDGVVDTISD